MKAICHKRGLLLQYTHTRLSQREWESKGMRGTFCESSPAAWLSICLCNYYWAPRPTYTHTKPPAVWWLAMRGPIGKISGHWYTSRVCLSRRPSNGYHKTRGEHDRDQKWPTHGRNVAHIYWQIAACASFEELRRVVARYFHRMLRMLFYWPRFWVFWIITLVRWNVLWREGRSLLGLILLVVGFYRLRAFKLRARGLDYNSFV
jgi:hypothetical protein